MQSFIYLINSMMNTLFGVYIRNTTAWFMALPLVLFVADRLYKFFRRMFV